MREVARCEREAPTSCVRKERAESLLPRNFLSSTQLFGSAWDMLGGPGPGPAFAAMNVVPHSSCSPPTRGRAALYCRPFFSVSDLAMKGESFSLAASLASGDYLGPRGRQRPYPWSFRQALCSLPPSTRTRWQRLSAHGFERTAASVSPSRDSPAIALIIA